MASWLCHLVAAGRTGVNFGGIGQAAFLLGNLSPDWSVFACGVNRGASHFKTSVPGEYMIDDFIDAYCHGTDRAREAFCWGYACHLILDRTWARRIYMPLIMGQPENEQAYHRYELGAIDQILLSRSEANQALRFLSSLPVPEEALRLAGDLVREGPYRRFLAALFERYTRTPSSVSRKSSASTWSNRLCQRQAMSSGKSLAPGVRVCLRPPGRGRCNRGRMDAARPPWAPGL
jgi:hypothetical protein